MPRCLFSQWATVSSLPLSLSSLPPNHPAALPYPKTRSPEAGGRLVAGVFDAAIGAAAFGVLFAAASETTLARAYCLPLDLEGSIGRAPHTHTHTHTLREVAELAINNRYML